ncbi:MAG TPA: bifunctional adenosylcobinamide kinase/adenosylcobinamide-phosphate guanylyltransferase [Gammaproteobacteria bacterium]|nr:bifunctional adenosylcobinamide kinase/adenosylcobinamide-phosphate guanylyltransferase [Gammaproteobacteria bacterium]
MKTLILGGVRSGKSRLAERLAEQSAGPVTYIATAAVLDKEMARRIQVHRERRPDHWTVVEAPRHLATAVRHHARPGGCVLIDCLTLWLTQCLCVGDDADFLQERTALVDAFSQAPGTIVCVSNETNMGVIPPAALSRRYCDEAGRLHQDLAQLCDRVVLAVAGLPHVLKGAPL